MSYKNPWKDKFTIKSSKNIYADIDNAIKDSFESLNINKEEFIKDENNGVKIKKLKTDNKYIYEYYISNNMLEDRNYNSKLNEKIFTVHMTILENDFDYKITSNL